MIFLTHSNLRYAQLDAKNGTIIIYTLKINGGYYASKKIERIPR